MFKGLTIEYISFDKDCTDFLFWRQKGYSGPEGDIGSIFKSNWDGNKCGKIISY